MLTMNVEVCVLVSSSELYSSRCREVKSQSLSLKFCFATVEIISTHSDTSLLQFAYNNAPLYVIVAAFVKAHSGFGLTDKM